MKPLHFNEDGSVTLYNPVMGLISIMVCLVSAVLNVVEFLSLGTVRLNIRFHIWLLGLPSEYITFGGRDDRRE